MKIILTNEEAQAIARDRVRMAITASLSNVVVDVGIEGVIEPPRHQPIDKIIRDIQSLNYSTHQKIQAIKRLREMVPGMGLAEAKWCIENWDTWKGRALQTQRLPKYRRSNDNDPNGYIIGLE